MWWFETMCLEKRKRRVEHLDSLEEKIDTLIEFRMLNILEKTFYIRLSVIHSQPAKHYFITNDLSI